MSINNVQVLVTGTFNLMHSGHVRLLEFASKYGEVTVGINTDAYLIKKYGEKTISLVDRAYVLNSCKFVKEVVAFKEDDPGELIAKLKPVYYIKGPDYAGVLLPEYWAIEKTNCKLVIHRVAKENSSSILLK